MAKNENRSVRARRAEQQARRQRQRRLYMGVGGAGLVLVVALVLWVRQINAPKLDEVLLPASLELPPNADGKAWGPVDAPVLIQVFSDFQCPFCKRSMEEGERPLMETYAATGQVRLEFHHYAFIGAESVRAAEAAECANEQGMFWPYHDTLFLNQSGENQGTFSTLALHNFAVSLKLDVKAFDSCVSDNRHETTINGDKQLGEQLGVGTTPSMVINGTLYTGARPFSDLQSIIQSELAGNSN